MGLDLLDLISEATWDSSKWPSGSTRNGRTSSSHLRLLVVRQAIFHALAEHGARSACPESGRAPGAAQPHRPPPGPGPGPWAPGPGPAPGGGRCG